MTKHGLWKYLHLPASALQIVVAKPLGHRNIVAAVMVLAMLPQCFNSVVLGWYPPELPITSLRKQRILRPFVSMEPGNGNGQR